MYLRNTKVYFQSTKVYSRSTKVYSPSTKVYFQSTSILSHYTSILSKNKSLLWKYESILWKYKSILWRKNPKTKLLRVLFDSIDLLALFGVYAGIISIMKKMITNCPGVCFSYKKGLYCCCWSVELELKKTLHQFWKLRCLQNRERNNSQHLGFENKLVVFFDSFWRLQDVELRCKCPSVPSPKMSIFDCTKKTQRSDWGFGFDCWWWFLNPTFLHVKCVLPGSLTPA